MPNNRLTTKANGFSAGQIERWRSKLRVAKAIEALGECVQGDISLSSDRLRAIELTLKKSVPDLASVELNHNTGDGVVFTWGVPTIAGKIVEGTAKQVNADNTGKQDQADIKGMTPAKQPIVTEDKDLSGDVGGVSDTGK